VGHDQWRNERLELGGQKLTWRGSTGHRKGEQKPKLRKKVKKW